MKCYYEILGVEKKSVEADIKAAYRKLALKWHPDKNLDALDEAKERFQEIQQAYDVLSDAHERAWYDKHRDHILRGTKSDYEDKSLDVFEYFTVSCFKGYGDDEKGFYAVYREVFKKIAQEDIEFMENKAYFKSIPMFGRSTSNYEKEVGPFYAYWSAYCTKKTYSWLWPQDIGHIKDRRVYRGLEKDIKKVIQKAKKERNEEVRNLVAFVRKRDKRIAANKRALEERAELNRKKQEQNRLEQIRRRQQEVKEMQQKNNQMIAEDNKDNYEEQLQQLECEYSVTDENSDEYEDNNDDNMDNENKETLDNFDYLYENADDTDMDYMKDLYCVACNRAFKSMKAFANHESSKKHRDNVEVLRQDINIQEESFNVHEESMEEEHLSESEQNRDQLEIDEIENDLVNKINELEIETKSRQNKRNKRKNKNPIFTACTIDPDDMDSPIEDENVEKFDSNICNIEGGSNDNDDANVNNWNCSKKKANKKQKNKKKNMNANKTNYQPINEAIIKTSPETLSNEKSCDDDQLTQHICVTCKAQFVSKNKLFAHLNSTNHAIYIAKPKYMNDLFEDDDDENQPKTRQKKAKGKRK